MVNEDTHMMCNTSVQAVETDSHEWGVIIAQVNDGGEEDIVAIPCADQRDAKLLKTVISIIVKRYARRFPEEVETSH